MQELGSRIRASGGSSPRGSHRSTLGWAGTLTAPCHPPVPWAGGWWQPLLAALFQLLLQAEFLVCRAMPVLPSRLALGGRAVLLLLLCQKELGAEQRGLLFQRSTAGHCPSQHHPGECAQLGLSNPHGHRAALVTTSWPLSSYQPPPASSQLPGSGSCTQSPAKPPGREPAVLCPYCTAPTTNRVAGAGCSPRMLMQVLSCARLSWCAQPTWRSSTWG